MAQYIIAGPCSMESMEQMDQIAQALIDLKINYMRAPLFKPRTSPDSFQGLGKSGLPILEEIKKKYPTLKLVSEICSVEQFNIIAPYADILQIGTRNMQNFELHKNLAPLLESQNKKVILKRGFANTFFEWIQAAKYYESYGLNKKNIILCERGTRNHCAPEGTTLDLCLALKIKFETDYEVIIDPSHGCGNSLFIPSIAKAIFQMPFDGMMLECHPDPKNSISDAKQAISLTELSDLVG